MKGFIVRLLITALGLWVADQLLPGIEITGTGALIVSALLLGIVNAIIRPILFVLTFPLTVITLGLFFLILNGITLGLVPGWCRASTSRDSRRRRSAPSSWTHGLGRVGLRGRIGQDRADEAGGGHGPPP